MISMLQRDRKFTAFGMKMGRYTLPVRMQIAFTAHLICVKSYGNGTSL